MYADYRSYSSLFGVSKSKSVRITDDGGKYVHMMVPLKMMSFCDSGLNNSHSHTLARFFLLKTVTIMYKY